MISLPSGTVTFLFTDIEGSTRLWEEHPEAMRAAVAVWLVLATRAMIQEERPEVAAWLWGSIGDMVVASDQEIQELELLQEELVQVRDRLGAEAYDAVITAGKALSVLQAARYALSEMDAMGIPVA